MTRYSNYPPAAARIHKVGSYIHPDLERIVSLSPDLCIATIVSVGANTFTHELIALAGGENLPESHLAYPRYTKEQLIALSPEILILFMSSGQTILKKDSLLLSGVMVNAFCSAIIMFLISLTQDSRLHNIIFWLMGDLSMADVKQTGLLALILAPCFLLLFWFSNVMNLLLMGKEMAMSMGVNMKVTSAVLLVVTSFMVSATVSYCGLLGFVGLVMPHLLRLILGPDHRVLVPACVLGGGAYMVLCDLLARVLPRQGEMPAGVITAMIGAPLFIYLLKRSGHEHRN